MGGVVSYLSLAADESRLLTQREGLWEKICATLVKRLLLCCCAGGGVIVFGVAEEFEEVTCGDV